MAVHPNVWAGYNWDPEWPDYTQTVPEQSAADYAAAFDEIMDLQATGGSDDERRSEGAVAPPDR